jgi:succinoglycan biosynthesis transport protein ExoP
MNKIGMTDLDDFRERTTVAQVRDTFVITISFDLNDPVRAAAGANAIAESFVSRSSTVETALQGAVSVWQPATPPVEPVSPRVALNTMLGAFAGGLVALGIMAIVSYLDDRISDFDRVRARVGIAPLEEVFRGTHPETMAGKLFVRDSPHSREAEAFRSLRTNIAFADVDNRPRSILVTSAVPSEGKSIVSANLALALAQEGTPTVLVDADLRRPSQHALFNVRSSEGLTTLISGNTNWDAVQRFRVSDNLIVIPSGPIPPNPAELLSSNKMTEFIQKLVGLTDGCSVIIDTSPVLAVADPLALSTKVDGCLLVIDATRTSSRVARQAVERLRTVKAKILGAVLNKVASAHGYYGYTYYGAADSDPSRPVSATPSTARTARHPPELQVKDNVK